MKIGDKVTERAETISKTLTGVVVYIHPGRALLHSGVPERGEPVPGELHGAWKKGGEVMRDMKTPFENDPFAMVHQAFQNLYPGKECRVFWEPDIRPQEDGDEVYGLTDFGDDGTIMVFVTPNMKVTDAVEILAHELAHVAVGADHDHDEVWGSAFDAIFQEYNRIGDEMYGKEAVE